MDKTFILELDSYCTFSIGSIDFDTIIELLFTLKNKNSPFSKWYLQKIISISNINKQYEALKNTLYFLDDVDHLKDKINGAYNFYSSQRISQSSNIFQPSTRTPVAVQMGGQYDDVMELIKEPKKAIVIAVKYLTNDHDDHQMQINDVLESYLFSFFSKSYLIMDLDHDNKKLFEMHLLNYQRTIDNFMAAYLDLCFVDYAYLQKYLFILSNFMKKIKQLFLDTHKQNPENYLTTYSDIINSLDNSMVIKNIVPMNFLLRESAKNAENKLISQLSSLKFKNSREYQNNHSKIINEITNMRKSIKDTSSHRGGKFIIKDVTGTDKPHKRKIFSVITDQERYVLKISASEEYYIESSVYYQIDQIKNNSNNKISKFLEDHVVNIIGYEKISSVASTDSFIIFSKSSNPLTVTSTKKSKIYEAINYFVSENRFPIHVLKTENLIGEWTVIEKIPTDASQLVPNLGMQILNLIVFLNNNYGFVHWDLHNNNVLVNKKYTTIKMFDYDRSEIGKIINDKTFVDMCFTRVHDFKARKNIGLIYDILRIYSTFLTFYSNNNPNMMWLKEMYVSYYLKNHMFYDLIEDKLFTGYWLKHYNLAMDMEKGNYQGSIALNDKGRISTPLITFIRDKFSF